MTGPAGDAKPPVSADQFFQCDVRVGTVVAARVNEAARVPALVLEIDFGPLGRRVTSAQITKRYTPPQLVGRQVAAVVNLPPKRVAGVASEALVLGGLPGPGDVVLLAPDGPVPDGTPVG